MAVISSIMLWAITACEPTNKEPVGLKIPRELTEYEKERCTESAVESTKRQWITKTLKG